MQNGRLPPGVSARDFARALAAWKAGVGERWVYTADEDLDLYRDACSPFWGEAEERLASAAVAPDSVEQVQQMVRVAGEHGWGEYRTAPAFMDTVMDMYSYNDHIQRRVDERIKDALDPKGILSPARYGIWPQHLRQGRR